MSREVVVLAWCDLCQQPEAAQGHVIEIDGLRREIDLCAEHLANTGLASLRGLLEASGRQPEVTTPNRNRGGRRARPGAATVVSRPTGVRHGRLPARADQPRPYPCPWCPLDYTQSSSLLSHARTVHGLAGAQGHGAVARLLGGHCPLCGAEALMLDDHCRTEHDVTWAAVVRKARGSGDTRGIVAALDRQAQQVEAGA